MKSGRLRTHKLEQQVVGGHPRRARKRQPDLVRRRRDLAGVAVPDRGCCCSVASNWRLPAPPSSPMKAPSSLKGPWINLPPGASAAAAPARRPSALPVRDVAHVRAVDERSFEASACTTAGHDVNGSETSRSTAGRTFLRALAPCASMRRRRSSTARSTPPIVCTRASTYSDGCHWRLGKLGAKCSRCAPVPLAISSAAPAADGSTTSAARRGWAGGCATRPGDDRCHYSSRQKIAGSAASRPMGVLGAALAAE